MKNITEVLIVLSIVAAIVTVGVSFYFYNSPIAEEDTFIPTFELSMDKDGRKLIVDNINFETDWTYVNADGDAIVPFGSIEVGDEITDCYGEVSIFLSGYFVNEYIFDESSGYIDPSLIFGEWETDDAEEEYIFYDDGTFLFDIKENDFDRVANYQSQAIGQYSNVGDISKLKVFGYYSDPNILYFTNSTNISFDFNYTFDNNYNKLSLSYNNSQYDYTRVINSVQTKSELLTYQNQKVNISGLFNKDDSNFILRLNDSEGTDINLTFKNHSIDNLSQYDQKNVEITGLIIPINEMADPPTYYMDYIENIRIL